ncbi:MAG: hypothetical protein HYR96_00505 [Deltaproteobacteria bacterium]|nr:hypothetical protein [Deltaproteobacteria bacterium]MBI3294733.1 hypothetical protein [Deltaproteobacteria bacterium]
MKIFAFGLSVLFLTTCGSRFSTTAPLTADQRKQFSETVDALGAAERSSKAAHQSFNRQSEDAGSPEYSKEMIDELRACEFRVSPGTSQMSLPSEPGATAKSDFDATFSASGAACPISLNLSFKGSMEMSHQFSKMNASFAYDYSVVNVQSFSHFVDITRMTANGTVWIETGATTRKGAIDYVGDATSTKYGKLRFFVKGSAGGSVHEETGDLTIGVEYPDHAVELKEVVALEEGQIAHRYTLNGETITKAEFDGYLRKLGELGGGGAGSGHASSESQTTEPVQP